MKFASAVIVVAATSFIASTANAATLLLAGFGGDAVYKFDGVTTTPFATHATMDGPTALVFDSAGNLLVLNEFSFNVLKFNGTTGAFMGTFLDTATLAGTGLVDPADMEVGADGNLYIMGHFNAPPGDEGNVHKFNSTTGAYMGVFATSSPVRHQHGMGFGTGGDLFQGNLDTRSVERFNGITGAAMGTFGGEPDMFPMADLAFSATTMYCTIHTGGLARFNSVSGAFIDYLEPTAGDGYWGLYVDGATLYASNLTDGTIRTYNSLTGAFLSETFVGGGVFDILPMPIPEPSSLALLAASATAILRRRKGLATQVGRSSGFIAHLPADPAD